VEKFTEFRAGKFKSIQLRFAHKINTSNTLQLTTEV